MFAAAGNRDLAGTTFELPAGVLPRIGILQKQIEDFAEGPQIPQAGMQGEFPQIFARGFFQMEVLAARDLRPAADDTVPSRAD